MSVVELGSFFAGDGKFGVNSASLMKISFLVWCPYERMVV